MVTLLAGAIRFPTGYSPWYVYQATLIASPASFTYLDMLFPDSSGNFDKVVTNDAVLTAGYCFALEAYSAGMTQVAVAVPGSIVPMITDNTVRPCGLVKLVYGSGEQSVTAAAAADLAAGKVIGRFRNHHENNELLRLPSANDIIIVLTGAC